MCKLCDGATEEEVRDELHAIVQRYGWAVQGVETEAGGSPFTYTIGLTGLGHPELVIVGVDHRVAGMAINELGERVRHGERFEPGRLGATVLGHSVELVEVDDIHVDEGLIGACFDYYEHYGTSDTEIDVVQVYVPTVLTWADGGGPQPRLDRPDTHVYGFATGRPPRRDRRQARRR